MEDYQQHLSDNIDDSEQNAAAQVLEGLKLLHLEAKVRKVAAERADLHRRMLRQRIFIAIVVLTFGAGAAYLIFRKKESSASSPTPIPPTEQSTDRPILPSNTTPTAPTPETASAGQPIAQMDPGERLANPRYPAPEITLIRGDATENKALKALLDQLWYTQYPLNGLKTGDLYKKADKHLKERDFPAAYLELTQLEGALAGNDTLRYLKGYCLLEMGEGAEALTYLDPVQGRHTAWETQLQWYRGLAMLPAGEQAKALALFRKLAGQPKHPYQRQAEKAVGLLGK